MTLIRRFLAHVSAIFGALWLLALGAHTIGLYEDPRFAQMSWWERGVIVLWGIASAVWWVRPDEVVVRRPS